MDLLGNNSIGESEHALSRYLKFVNLSQLKASSFGVNPSLTWVWIYGLGKLRSRLGSGICLSLSHSVDDIIKIARGFGS